MSLHPIFKAYLFFSLSTLYAAFNLHASDASIAPVLNVSEKIEALKDKNLLFTPPAGWHFADTASLPASVKSMVVGKGAYYFPPSINLGTEIYAGSLKQYLKRIKEINNSQGNAWKDLGSLHLSVGKVSLSQIETQTQWGEVKMMHLIFKEQETIYILTAAALKKEFPKFYKDFFQTFRSLRLEKDLHKIEAICDTK